MKKLLSVCIALAMLLSFLPSVFAQDLEAAAAKLYNDLADIIESNMTNPEQCMDQAREYIDSHQDALAKARQLDELGKQRAQSGQRGTMSQEQAMESLSQNEFAQATFRFSDALSNFSMENSEQANQIAEMAQ